MQRLRDDRGAVAVLTALLLVPLLVCAALVVDIGASYVMKRQLQNAADAAALAIAQDCGKGICSAAGNQTTANSYTSANAPGRAATAQVDPVGATDANVTVTTKATVNYAFAPVINVSNNTFTAKATASWRYPTGGTAVLPLAISRYCFDKQPPLSFGSRTASNIDFHGNKSSQTGPCASDAPNGGFGWLTTDVAPCKVTSAIGVDHPSNTGLSADNACNGFFGPQLGQTVLLPLFDTLSASGGSGGTYHIYRYAAFHLMGFHFASLSGGEDCGNNGCIRGYFVKYVELSDNFTSGSDARFDSGARIVTLTA